MNAPRDIDQQRARARRTAWRLAIVVGIIFATFFMSGVIGR